MQKIWEHDLLIIWHILLTICNYRHQQKNTETSKQIIFAISLVYTPFFEKLFESIEQCTLPRDNAIPFHLIATIRVSICFIILQPA